MHADADAVGDAVWERVEAAAKKAAKEAKDKKDAAAKEADAVLQAALHVARHDLAAIPCSNDIKGVRTDRPL